MHDSIIKWMSNRTTDYSEKEPLVSLGIFMHISRSVCPYLNHARVSALTFKSNSKNEERSLPQSLIEFIARNSNQ